MTQIRHINFKRSILFYLCPIPVNPQHVTIIQHCVYASNEYNKHTPTKSQIRHTNFTLTFLLCFFSVLVNPHHVTLIQHFVHAQHLLQ